MSESINVNMIEELQELMAEDFSLLVETFLTDCETRLQDLAVAITENNATNVRELAHGFKGSSSNLGAEKLSAICFSLEAMGRTGQIMDAKETLQQLCDEYQCVKTYLSSTVNLP